MSEPVYLGVDLGTQSVRLMAVGADGAVKACASQPLASVRDGVRHEQDPEQWWSAVVHCARSVMAELGSGRTVNGIAVDATSGTILLIDDRLRPLTPALMYDDGRAGKQADQVNEAGCALWSTLSYRMQASWALPKLLWLSQSGTVGNHARLAHQNDFVNARLAGRRLATDFSTALKTGADLIGRQWPWQIFESLSLDAGLFPPLVLPGTQIGEVCAPAAELTGIPAGTRIFAGMTDGCAAQMASGATTVGSWNSVIGTTIVVKGVTAQLIHDPLGVVYSHVSPQQMWLPGGASSAGAGVIAQQFPAAGLESLNAAAQAMSPSSAVVYPLAGKGERYPFTAPDATGFVIGQAQSTAEMYLAVLQGIAFVERLAFDALRKLGAPVDGVFTISGGATRSEALNRIRASVMQKTARLPAVAESVFGAAMLAAIHDSSVGEVTARMVRIQRTIDPGRSFEAYASQYIALVDELDRRGWLPPDLAAYARAGASA